MLKKGKISKKYNKIVWGFIALSVLIVLFVGYFAFAHTSIMIYPARMEETASFQVTLSDLEGEISETEVSGTETYSDFEDTTTVESEGRAGGTVTIVNESSADQPLVATTRLLSEEGVLFRTQESVVVPRGGTVEAEVLADEPGAKGDIGPSRFEIVALNQAKKEYIYAESDRAMTGGTSKIGVVSEKDITEASERLSQRLSGEAVEKLKEEAEHPENIRENTVEKRILESEVSHEPGEEAACLEVYEKLKVSNISFDEDALLTVAARKLEENMDMGNDLVSEPTLDDIEYAVISIDENGDNAVIKIIVRGARRINENNAILEKAEITNKTKSSIRKYFNNFDEIDRVEVDFSPFWVQTSPLMDSQIEFEIRSDDDA